MAAHKKWMNICRRTHTAFSDAELQNLAMDRALNELKEKKEDAAKAEERRAQ
jgi:hypothetical protein